MSGGDRRPGAGVRRAASGVQIGLAVGAAIAMLASSAWAGEAKVDWASGLVTARGIGLADRHAPSPAVALGTSRRPAEEAAKKELRAAALALPVAGGGTVKARAKDPAVKARLDRALEAAFAVAAEPQTDGSWEVTMALPIEAVRQAIDGPRELLAAGDTGPAVVVIEGVHAKPAVGWKVGGLAAATVWVAQPPDYAKTAPHVHAQRAAGDAIAISGMQGTAVTLFVIVEP